jgi:hypothetical protein
VYDVKSERVAARHYAVICKKLLISRQKQVSRVVLGFSEDGACTDLFENLSVNSLKGDLSWTYRMLPLSTHLFSHLSIPLKNQSHVRLKLGQLPTAISDGSVFYMLSSLSIFKGTVS